MGIADYIAPSTTGTHNPKTRINTTRWNDSIEEQVAAGSKAMRDSIELENHRRTSGIYANPFKKKEEASTEVVRNPNFVTVDP